MTGRWETEQHDFRVDECPGHEWYALYAAVEPGPILAIVSLGCRVVCPSLDVADEKCICILATLDKIKRVVGRDDLDFGLCMGNRSFDNGEGPV